MNTSNNQNGKSRWMENCHCILICHNPHRIDQHLFKQGCRQNWQRFKCGRAIELAYSNPGAC